MSVSARGFILASGSKARREILEALGYSLEKIAPQDVDETPLGGEIPTEYVKRITQMKMDSAVKLYPNEVILCADTIVAVGRRILQKAETLEEQRCFMEWMSGRRHYNLTHVRLYTPAKKNPFSERLVKTLVQLKKLTPQEIQLYLDTGVWRGCSGYQFDWLFQSFVKRMDGSFSSIAGLPVYETKNLLSSAGIFLP